MAAIFAALRSWKIIYNNPPASYETIGQRVRLPHKVLEEKQGTCLDLSVLYAACLEAAGLFPLLVFIKGHAFCGCWLEQQTFCDCAVDDVSAIEKRISEGNEEILLVECTNFTFGNNVDFERAIKHGNDHLNNTTDFQYVVDIQRSRGSGIRPIPVRINQAYSDCSYSNESTDNTDNISAPKELNRSDVGTLEYSESNLSRVQIWERKLLDFSLRNTLLNFRVTKNTLQLMTSNLAELEDRLSDNVDFRIMEVPSEWSVSVRDAKMYEIENERDLIENIASQEFKNNRIRTFLPPVELDRNLKNLYRGAKVSIEENGTNTLFLALGFLRWFESDLSEKPRYAPIVLIPVDIVKSPRNKGYIIRSRQEEPQINITLIEYLRQIFGLKIPNLDPLPLDEHGTDLPLVFNTIRNAVMDKKRWNIENLAFLGLFSFGQFVMWNDLHNRSEELKTSKVVSSLIDKKLSWTAEPLFIKNLENVQGDERDVILFSIGYGPDKEGKVSMNFGPLNRDGGWRRLNVAISRARKSMTVYSTITPEQIDLSRTRSDGVAGLKGFLEFAGKGKNIITQKANAVPKEKDALIEEVSKEIERLGYEVKRNIGYSEYKMDIGIVNPNNKQTYVLGILLDGKNCKNSATAKDRFVLQPDILTGLGWNIMRVWTLDWLDNPQKVIDSIAEEIHSAVEKYGKNPVQTTAVKANPDVVKFEKLDMTSSENSVSRKRSYQSFGIKPLGTSESFYEPYSRNKIRSLMKNIIEAEAPISRKALFKKVLSAWGITRSGNKVEAILDNAITFVEKSETYENGSIFYWKKDQNPREYSIYRVDECSDLKRSIDDISSYEILNASIEVLNEQISLSSDDLVKETAKKLGFSRSGTLIDTTVRNAVLLGQQNNILKTSNDNKASLC